MRIFFAAPLVSELPEGLGSNANLVILAKAKMTRSSAIDNPPTKEAPTWGASFVGGPSRTRT